MLNFVKKFRGGIHPADNKELSASKPIEKMPIPSTVIIPLKQHIGAPCNAIVNKGDIVLKGQVIATSLAPVSSPIHASTSGKVLKIEDYPHPVFGTCPSVFIESDGLDNWVEGLPLSRNWNEMTNAEILAAIKENGLVGMGGATFPTHVKLEPPKSKVVHTLVVNGAECEPYLTSDYRVMLERTEDIIEGIKISMKVLNINKAIIGVEDNKPAAVEALALAVKNSGGNIEVVSLPVRYPQGGEKMLIKALLNAEVPSLSLPADVGVVVQNVATMAAVTDAVVRGIPLIERVTTVTGEAITEPKNVLVRFGTTYKEVIDYCGGLKYDPDKIVTGGPMMGFAQTSTDVPVIKGVSGILAVGKAKAKKEREENCIRCSACLDACPMGLNPSMLSILGERSLFEEAKKNFNLLDCIECGCCSYVCPSKRNIVQYIKHNKALNIAAANKKQA